MSNDMDDVKEFLADSTVKQAMAVLQLMPQAKLAVRLTTHSGTKYLIACEGEQYKAARRGAEDEVMGTKWFPIDPDSVRPVNIWGSLQIGHWTTTSVVKVELATSVRNGGQAITVFER